MKIGLTQGDPAGIGAEIIIKSLQNLSLHKKSEFVVYGDEQLCKEINGSISSDQIRTVVLTDRSQFPAWNSLSSGQASILYLEKATQDAIDQKIDALVTAPISKTNVQKAGFLYPGHTEFLAARTGASKVVMMMAAPKLKVTLVTIHLPLSEVPKTITISKIIDTVTITYRGLQNDFGILSPKIAVCGLNPHAGEGGILGTEEQTIIQPAIDQLSRDGLQVEGPLVPDAVFHQAYEGKYDAVVCMYHDQGLIPFKMLHFRDGVNVSLGLKIIRTSPDHGVAYDIAGKGEADPSSFLAAIELAIEMIQKRKANLKKLF